MLRSLWRQKLPKVGSSLNIFLLKLEYTLHKLIKNLIWIIFALVDTNIKLLLI